MKNIEQVKQDIELLEKNCIAFDGNKKMKSEVSRMKDQLYFLRIILLVLESRPDERQIKRLYKQISEKIKYLESQWEPPKNADRMASPLLTKIRKAFEHHSGLDKYRYQLKVIDYVLN